MAIFASAPASLFFVAFLGRLTWMAMARSLHNVTRESLARHSNAEDFPDRMPQHDRLLRMVPEEDEAAIDLIKVRASLGGGECAHTHRTLSRL